MIADIAIPARRAASAISSMVLAAIACGRVHMEIALQVMGGDERGEGVVLGRFDFAMALT